MEIEQIEEQLALDQAKLRLTREQLQQFDPTGGEGGRGCQRMD